MSESTKHAITFKAIALIFLYAAFFFDDNRIYYLTAAYVAVTIGWFILIVQARKREKE